MKNLLLLMAVFAVVATFAAIAMGAAFMPGVPFSGGPIPEGAGTPGAALPAVPNGGVNYVPPPACSNKLDFSVACNSQYFGMM